jgi:glycosyltransferase involved in cell wall biosynthesis
MPNTYQTAPLQPSIQPPTDVAEMIGERLPKDRPDAIVDGPGLGVDFPWPAAPHHRVSVVIPALNEAESLPLVLPRIPLWVHEVILVDGHSSDDTVRVAREHLPGIRVLTQIGKGKGAALRTGVEAASGDIIVTLDADGSTDPAEIPAFVGALIAGADFVKGSRFGQGCGSTDMTPIRWVGNWGFVLLTNALFRTQFSDITYGYNALWARHKQALALEIDDWSHEIISNIRVALSGLRLVEVASVERERVAGEAKLRTWSAGWMILKAIVRERITRRARPGVLAGHRARLD